MIKEFYSNETRKASMSTFYNETDKLRMTDHWKEIESLDSDLAFVIDMDAQFIFVPKMWVRNILLLKILKLMTCLVQG